MTDKCITFLPINIEQDKAIIQENYKKTINEILSSQNIKKINEITLILYFSNSRGEFADTWNTNIDEFISITKFLCSISNRDIEDIILMLTDALREDFETFCTEYEEKESFDYKGEMFNHYYCTKADSGDHSYFFYDIVSVLNKKEVGNEEYSTEIKIQEFIKNHLYLIYDVAESMLTGEDKLNLIDGIQTVKKVNLKMLFTSILYSDVFDCFYKIIRTLETSSIFYHLLPDLVNNPIPQLLEELNKEMEVYELSTEIKSSKSVHENKVNKLSLGKRVCIITFQDETYELGLMAGIAYLYIFLKMPRIKIPYTKLIDFQLKELTDDKKVNKIRDTIHNITGSITGNGEISEFSVSTYFNYDQERIAAGDAPTISSSDFMKTLKSIKKEDFDTIIRRQKNILKKKIEDAEEDEEETDTYEKELTELQATSKRFAEVHPQYKKIADNVTKSYKYMLKKIDSNSKLYTYLKVEIENREGFFVYKNSDERDWVLEMF